MAIIHERQTAGKPTQVDPKTGKPLPQRAASPTAEAIEAQNSGGFFSSFWASKNKKKMASMEPPPPTLRASASLSERESTEVEVISKRPCSLYFSGSESTNLTIVLRASYYFLL